MHTKDDKAYATLTDVKNKTGDVFAMADEFGEVTITSYNKSKYLIKRLLISHSRNADVEAEVGELDAEPEEVPESVPEAAAVVTAPVVEVEQASEPAVVTTPENIEPVTVSAETLLTPTAELSATAATAVVPTTEVIPTPTLPEVPTMPTVEPTPVPVAPVVTAISEAVNEPLQVVNTTAGVQQSPEPPAIELMGLNGVANKVPLVNTANNAIVGIFAGISGETLWDRNSRIEQGWSKQAHGLL